MTHNEHQAGGLDRKPSRNFRGPHCLCIDLSMGMLLPIGSSAGNARKTKLSSVCIGTSYERSPTASARSGKHRGVFLDASDRPQGRHQTSPSS